MSAAQDALARLVDLMTAVAADHPELDASLIVVADNAGHIEYRSRLSEPDLNRLLALIAVPLGRENRDDEEAS
jgi:hypothetical protein